MESPTRGWPRQRQRRRVNVETTTRPLADRPSFTYIIPTLYLFYYFILTLGQSLSAVLRKRLTTRARRVDRSQCVTCMIVGLSAGVTRIGIELYISKCPQTTARVIQHPKGPPGAQHKILTPISHRPINARRVHRMHRKEGQQREYRPIPAGNHLTNTHPPLAHQISFIDMMLAQSSYHAQSSPNTPNAQPPQNTSPSDQSAPQQQQQQQQQPQQPQPPQPGTIQTMRLRQDPPSVTQSQTRSRKRKSPPSADALQSVQPPPPPPPSTMQHTLPPAHTLVPPAHLSGHGIPPPGYHYPPGDFNPTGLPPPHSLPPPPGEEQRPQSQPSNGSAAASGANRTLSQSKRAEQNRKAQRAFRERRDQCVLSNHFFFCLRMTDGLDR
jgi:hypothetical protein